MDSKGIDVRVNFAPFTRMVRLFPTFIKCFSDSLLNRSRLLELGETVKLAASSGKPEKKQAMAMVYRSSPNGPTEPGPAGNCC